MELNDEIMMLEDKFDRITEELKLLKVEITNKKIEFYKVKYGSGYLEVIEDYKQMIYDCCIQGFGYVLGHYLDVPLPKGARDYCHRVLDPEHYEKCKPTDKILDAFNLKGVKISIEDKPRPSYWGN